MTRLILFSIFMALGVVSQATEHKSLQATRTTESIKIDGKLNEQIWQTAPMATDFVQHGPNPGSPASQPSEVQIVYDNQAIYLSARLYDVSRDSILRQLSNRDQEENTDVFGVFLDPYNDDQNGYAFVVHPTGVQFDARYSATGQDVSWDAVWQSAVTIDDKNWYVEMKIPYSAIRFPDKEVHTWGINFARKIRRKREFSFWNETLPSVDGLVQQFGDLTDISNISAPPRLAFIPYLSAFVQNINDPRAGLSETSSTYRGGMDLKYGINDAFTLDVTLIPDFGQVQSDNLVLNLSPFEVFFQERRPFFMEGTELFNKSGLFYSRRIGGRPINFYDAFSAVQEGEELVDNPSTVQLLNSTKLTGRTKGKLGIGVLNSVTSEEYATIKKADGTTRSVITAPYTNYNVIVVDQTLKNNSYVSLTNTNVMRMGSDYDANVTGVNMEFRNKKNSHAVYGDAAFSSMFKEENETGFRAKLGVKKQSGNFQYRMDHEENSDTYNINDLGFQTFGNYRRSAIHFSYQTFKPKGMFNSTNNNIRFSYSSMFHSNKFNQFGVGSNHTFTTKKFHSFGLWTYSEPIENHDYYETRDFDRYYTQPTNVNLGGWLSSDYRKRIALDGRVNYRYYQADRKRLNFGIEPRVRVNDHLFFVAETNFNIWPNNEGWAATLEDGVIFSKRDERQVTSSIRGNYIFTNRMGLSFRARHYWATANYKSFHELMEDGSLGETTYDGLDASGENRHNVNFNAFNVDIIYTWVFAPGSQLNITYKSAILSSNGDYQLSYGDNVDALLNDPRTNSLSIKLLYYLDYLSLKKRN